VREHLSQVPDDIGGVVPRPGGRPCRDEEDVVLGDAAPDGVADPVGVVGHDRVAVRLHARLREDRCGHQGVALHHLSGRRHNPGRHELAPGGDEAGTDVQDIDLRDSVVCERSHVLWPDPVVRGEDHLRLPDILADRADVLPGADRLSDGIGLAVDPDVLDHHHRVVTGRDDVPRVDPCRVGKGHRVLLACPEGLGAPDRDPIHRR